MWYMLYRGDRFRRQGEGVNGGRGSGGDSLQGGLRRGMGQVWSG